MTNTIASPYTWYENLIGFCINEAMTFLTLIICFPGLLPPKDRIEWVIFVLLFIHLSVIWWFFLALFPIVYLILWWSGDLAGFNPYFHSWPFQ